MEELRYQNQIDFDELEEKRLNNLYNELDDDEEWCEICGSNKGRMDECVVCGM